MIFNKTIAPNVHVFYSETTGMRNELVGFSMTVNDDDVRLTIGKKDGVFSLHGLDGPMHAVIALLGNMTNGQQGSLNDLKNPAIDKIKEFYDLHQQSPTGFYEDHISTAIENV